MTEPHSIENLARTISDIDSLQAEEFGKIIAIAGLASAALQGSNSPQTIERAYQALLAIDNMARQAMEFISSEADSVGCHYVDPRLIARLSR